MTLDREPTAELSSASRPAVPPREPAPEPLTIICPDCGGEGRKIRSRYGGNDPDTWDAGPCDRCETTGYAVLCCDGCDNPKAVEWFMGGKWCVACAIIAKEDALVVGED